MWLNDKRLEFRKYRQIRRALDASSRKAGGVDRPLPGELVVSLTSYPPRFAHLHYVLKSLLSQSVAPDRIVLYLDEGDEKTLPKSVRRLAGPRLNIEVRPALRSPYAKLVHALTDFPNANIITVDDDVIYPGFLIEDLTSGAAALPGTIVCLRAHRLAFTLDGILLPYLSWPLDVQDDYARSPSVDLMATGVGGVLYPPNSLHPDATDMDTALQICRSADDVWFYWMGRRAGTAYAKVGRASNFLYTYGSQDVGLRHENWGGANDRQIRAMWAKYGPPMGLGKVRLAAEAK